MNNMKGIASNGNSVTRLHDSKITTEYPKKSSGTSFLKKIKRFINKLEHFSLQKTVKPKDTQLREQVPINLKAVSVKTVPTLSLAPSLDSRVVTPPPPPPMPSVNLVITPPMAKFDGIAKGTTSQPHGEGKVGMDAVISQLKEHSVFKKNAEKYQVTTDEITGSINTLPSPPPPMAKFDGIAKGTASQPHGEGKIGMDAVISQLKEHSVFKKNAEKYQVTADEKMGSINTPPSPPPIAKFDGIAKRIESQSHEDAKAGMDQVIAQLKEHPIFKLKESD
ncbi:hypothetical protein [Providencia stuartii]|uniref:Uncharacterized protein n=1 Tax=Providencia stuartii TaxID=588 RepID=A0A1S1HKW6_PROST|nr:hypothetical protein [Providencia stuartii]OHT22969.1 hypothetical protein A3Q29_08490 [Providencia stuartii]